MVDKFITREKESEQRAIEECSIIEKKKIPIDFIWVNPTRFHLKGDSPPFFRQNLKQLEDKEKKNVYKLIL